MKSSLKAPVLKACVVAGAAVAAVTFGQGEAQADPMVSSWYGPGLEGNLTASGEVFDPSGYTAASLTYPFGTRLLVSYGGRSTVVIVNDRGPYVAGRQIDLSQAAAEEIGLTAAGVDYVDVEVLGY